MDFQEGVTIIKNPIASDDIKLFISQIEQRAEERGYKEGHENGYSEGWDEFAGDNSPAD